MEKKSIWLGLLAGTISSVICYFTFESNSSMSFAEEFTLGILASFTVSIFANIMFPGLTGGGHNKSPYYLGGGGGSGRNSGIILTDEDQKAKRENERKIP